MPGHAGEKPPRRVLALEDAGRLWRWAGLLGRFASVQVVVQAVNLTQRINERVQQEARVQKSGFVQR